MDFISCSFGAAAGRFTGAVGFTVTSVATLAAYF